MATLASQRAVRGSRFVLVVTVPFSSQGSSGRAGPRSTRRRMMWRRGGRL